MTNERTKAVLYARVSSKDQEKEGFSIPAQLKLLKNFAKEHDFEIVEEYTEAESAKSEGRTKFNEMLKYLKKHNDVKTILVEKTDRLYRNLRDYVNLSCEKYNIYLVKEGNKLTPESTCDDKFMHGINVLVAKRFIDNLRAETQKGRQTKIEDGFFIGQVPYGYKKINKNDTVAHPQKSKFVKRAFELYSKGDISLKNLTQKLYDEGYIYTQSHPKISTGQLGKMLQNDSYIGFIRHRGKVYQGRHPHLISKQLFLKTQKAFKKDGKPDTRHWHNFLYKGIMKCAECGCAITSEIKKNKWIYYHCTGNSIKPCSQKKQYIKQEEIDLQIDKAIQQVVIDEKLSDYINVLLEENYKEMQVDTQDKYDYLTTEIKKFTTRKDKLLEMYMDDEIKKDVWVKKTNEIDAHIQAFENKLKSMKLSNEQFIDVGKNIIECSKQAYNLYKKQDIDEKRRLLDIIFENITVENRMIKYTYKKPFCYFAKCNLEDVESIVEYIKNNINN